MEASIFMEKHEFHIFVKQDGVVFLQTMAWMVCFIAAFDELCGPTDWKRVCECVQTPHILSHEWFHCKVLWSTTECWVQDTWRKHGSGYLDSVIVEVGRGVYKVPGYAYDAWYTGDNGSKIIKMGRSLYAVINGTDLSGFRVYNCKGTTTQWS